MFPGLCSVLEGLTLGWAVQSAAVLSLHASFGEPWTDVQAVYGRVALKKEKKGAGLRGR